MPVLNPLMLRTILGSPPGYKTIEFFTVCTKLAEMALLSSKELTTAKKKLPPVGLNLMQEIITGSGVQCLTTN